MDELLPYEEQLAGKLANLPQPDEDMGWDAMRKMLDEDDHDGGIIPPVNRGCRTWTALLLLIAMVTGIVTLTWKKHTVKQTDAPHNVVTIKDSSLAGKTAIETDTITATVNKTPDGAATDTLQQHDANSRSSVNTITPVQQRATKRGATAYANKRMTVRVDKTRGLKTGDNNYKINNAPPTVKDTSAPLNSLNTSSNIANDTPVSPAGGAAAAIPGNKAPDTYGTGYTNKPGTDSVKLNDTTAKPVTHATTAFTDNDSRKKKQENDDDENKVWFGAGLALQQLIPVDGQKAVPYSSSGRKGSLGDYTPSAYFRVYHKRKFLQVEFKYGAPQYTKYVAYQKTVISSDSASGISVANVNNVKKTYYHQLPISIHYTPVPNFSLGAGVVWNKFQSAVVEQQTRSFRGNVLVDTNGAAIPTKLLTLKGDSAASFSKSYLQFMVEAQYSWRRFSLGARYAFGLQPYLTFTSPTTGQPQKERNASLNIFIRYELWRSKKK